MKPTFIHGEIRNKYFDTSPAVRASIWFAICSILQRGISVLTMPIFTRLLSTDEYGLFTVYSSWYSIFRVFATLSLEVGVFNNAMITFKEDRDAYTSASLGLTTTSAIIFSIFIVFVDHITGGVTNLPTILLYVMSLELIFNSATALFTARRRFEYDYKSIVIATLFVSLVSPVLGYFAVISTDVFKAEARIVSYILVQVVVGLCLYVEILRKGRRLYDPLYWRYALKFNIPLIPHHLSMMILGQSDRIMIGKLCSNAEAAVYGIAYMISQLMIIATDAIGSTFTPYTYKAISEKKYLDLKKNANTLSICVCAGVLFVICIGPEIIKIFAPVEYYEARWVIPPVSLSVFYIFLYPLFSNVEFYFGKRTYVMIGSIIGAFFNIILNYILIPKYGFIAAGYTTLFSYMLLVVIHYIIQRKIIRKEIGNIELFDGKTIILISIALNVIVLFMLPFYDNILIRYGFLIMLSVIIFIKRKRIIGKIKAIRSQ